MITEKVKKTMNEIFEIEDKDLQVIKLEEKLLNKEIGELGATHIIERMDKHQVDKFCIGLMNCLQQEGKIKM